MGRKEERFVRALIDGAPWTDAARAAGLPEARARSFLESVARFAGAVGSVYDFATPAAPSQEASVSARASTEFVIHTDGASLGNPGAAGAGAVIATSDGEVIDEVHEHLGVRTNNVAEYEAVRIGIARAIALGARRILVRTDSELVANQLTGRYRVRDPKLIDAYLRVEQLLAQLDHVRFETIPREENKRADALAKMGARARPAGSVGGDA